MNIADLVKDTSTSTGTGNFVLSGFATSGFQLLAAVGGVGATFGYRIDNGAEWEVGKGTITAGNTFSRAPTASSNAGSLVNFSAGTKTVMNVVTAAEFSNFKSTRDIAFSAALPFDYPGESYMPQQTMTGALALSVGAGAVKGALVYFRIVGDGVNTPTFPGFKEWGGSMGFDPRNGIVNQGQAFFDGYDRWISWSQAVGAVAVDGTAPQLSNPTATQTGPNTATGSVTTDEGNGTLYCLVSANATETNATVRASGIAQTVTSAGAKSFSIANLAASTLYYLHYAHRDLSNNDSTVANSGSFTTAAAATVPSTMAAPVITAGDGQISIEWTAPAANGSAIIDATFTASTGQTVTSATSPATMTVPNGTAVTVTGKARNGMGVAANPSPASNSVTPAVAGPSYVRFAQLSQLAESGTADPRTYTGSRGDGWSSNSLPSGGMATKKRQVGVNGRVSVVRQPSDTMLSLTTSAGLVGYGSQAIMFYDQNGYQYTPFVNGAGQSPAAVITPAVGDIMQLRWVTAAGSTTVYGEISKDGGSTFTVFYTWANVPDSVINVQAQAIGGFVAGLSVGMA